jgi:hypothetical protein
LTEVNKGNIVFNLNHTYTILYKCRFVKQNPKKVCAVSCS